MELARFPSHGRFSVRSIITFVLTALITVFLSTIITSTPAHAADANWNGAMLQYDGRDHYLVGTTSADNPIESIPNGSMYYVSAETPSGTSATTLKKAHVIYLSPGLSPPGDGNATYLTFNYDSRSKTFSSPSSKTDITVDTASINNNATTCAIEGIGWFVCPTMNFLAKGMDWVFGVISSFMEVQPLQTGDTQSALYNAWNIMRSVANVVFIIFFLVIIYSQLTGVQVNNYGIKRLLPRLIIAAIAINLSYIICAIAIDASNILGYSIHQLFIGLRDTLLSTGVMDSANKASLLSWESIVGVVLSAGTAATASVLGVIAITGSVVAAAYLLLPVLVGLLMAILVVLLILAARQALIVILVIIAPLAIVVYLLPNTEKWFEKWRSLFFTMLIFFPAFSVVFGGSQLAGAVIIQNADSLNMLILGMIVQVAPLVITPLLLKFSGSLLGSIARMVNTPNKGVIDRTRNFARGEADATIARRNANLDRKGNPLVDKNGNLRNSRNPIRRSARYLDQRKRLRKDQLGIAESASQTGYENSRLYGKNDIVEQKAYQDHYKEATHSNHAAHIDAARQTPGSLVYKSSISALAAKDKAEAASNSTAAFYNRIRTDEALAKRVGAGALYTSSYNLETSKLTAETAQNAYTASVDIKKTNPTTHISYAARQAQSSKEHLEVAQNQLQAFFDTSRKTVGSELNVSSLNLERSKSNAEIAKDQFTTYITNERSQPGGSLRTITAEAEKFKQKKEIADTELSAMVEEFKSGKITNNLTTQQQTIMQEMQADAVRLGATKRAVVSAQFETQSNYANTLTSTGPLADQMLDIAQGVGGSNARIRAQADAVKAARSLESSELTNSIELLKSDAARGNSNIKHYSAGIVNSVLDGLPMYDNQPNTPERVKAALAAQADEKNMSLFERVSGSTNFDQSMVNEVIDMYRSNFKGAGGFVRQDDPNLNIDNFATADDYWHALRVSRISNLANANATGISGLKFGWVATSLAEQNELKANIVATLDEVKRAEKPNPTPEDLKASAAAKASLEGAFRTVRKALTNDDVLATFTDREGFVREIEAVLAGIHGLKPLDDDRPELQNLDTSQLNDIFKVAATKNHDIAENIDPDADAPVEGNNTPNQS